MINTTVNRDNLDDVMEFDHVIEVHADGTVTEPSEVWAPDVWINSEDGIKPTVSGMTGTRWELINGYSGQDSYSGPIMHPSEYVGGRLADHILETPGVYAVVEVRDQDADTDNGEDDSAGWAVARLITD